MEFYKDLRDGGSPVEQKSHKLQLETKSNVAIYQKKSVWQKLCFWNNFSR